MKSIQAYFDGTAVRPLEKLEAMPNQMLKIMILDKFISESQKQEDLVESLCGSLNKYANVNLIPLEESAWENDVKERFSNAQ